jgi:hypothetical protein
MLIFTQDFNSLQEYLYMKPVLMVANIYKTHLLLCKRIQINSNFDHWWKNFWEKKSIQFVNFIN